MKTEYGVKVIALPRYFAKIPFASWLVSLLKSVILFVKDIAKTPSVRVFFPLMKSLSYALLLAIQRPIHMNFGSYEKIRPWARGLRVMRLKTIGHGRGGHPWWAHPYSS
jgi:hypothetical protein